MKTLKDIRDAADAAEYQVKLAAVAEAYGGDAECLALLDEAIDLVKQAEEAGEIAPTTESGMLTVAVQLVEDYLDKMAADADFDESDDTLDDISLDKEAAAHVTALGEAAAQILASRGITQEDLDKVASDSEMRDIGEYVACALLDSFATDGEN